VLGGLNDPHLVVSTKYSAGDFYSHLPLNPTLDVTALGAERAPSIWNDQMALLPWGLSRILGITVYLGIPTYLPGAALVAGAVLAISGSLLTLPRRRAFHKDRSTATTLPRTTASSPGMTP